jgi:hypothetical protein
MTSDAMSTVVVARGYGALFEALADADVPAARVDVAGRVPPGDYERRIDEVGLRGRIR